MSGIAQAITGLAIVLAIVGVGKQIANLNQTLQVIIKEQSHELSDEEILNLALLCEKYTNTSAGQAIRQLMDERNSAIKLADWNKDCATMALGKLEVAEEERDRYRKQLSQRVYQADGQGNVSVVHCENCKQALGEDDADR